MFRKIIDEIFGKHKWKPLDKEYHKNGLYTLRCKKCGAETIVDLHAYKGKD